MAAIGLALVFALGLAVRLQPVLSHAETRRGGLGIFGDAWLYHAIALSLVDGQGFAVASRRASTPGGMAAPVVEPVVTRGPVYPFFLSLVYRFFVSAEDLARTSAWPQNLNKVRCAQAVLDALNCFAVFAIARVMCPQSFIPALLAAMLCALCPYNIYYTRAILKESVTTSVLTWTMLFAALAIRDRSLVWSALAGAGFGVVALCTPQFLLFAPLLAGATVIAHRRVALGIAKVAVVLLLAWASVIAPWTLRNYGVFGRFIPVSTGDLGWALFLGTFESNTNWTGWNEFPDEIFATESHKQQVLAARDRFLTEVASGSDRVTESDRFFRRLALERFTADPLGSLVLGLRRLPRLWFQFYIPMYADREASGGYFLFYASFAIYALMAVEGNVRVRMLPVVLLFLYQNAVYLPLHVEPRYATPVIPSILCLTAIGLFLVAAKLRAHRARSTRSPRTAPASSVCINKFVVPF